MGKRLPPVLYICMWIVGSFVALPAFVSGAATGNMPPYTKEGSSVIVSQRDPSVLNATQLNAQKEGRLAAINEIYAAPGIDTDGNGRIEQEGDAFIELVNTRPVALDVSGWSLLQAAKQRHIFPKGTLIPASGALLLFGEANEEIEGYFGGAVIQRVNQNIPLALDERGGTITLVNVAGDRVAYITYPPTQSNQSINLVPEVQGTHYKNHASIGGSGGFAASPGTKVDGTSFGAAYATRMDAGAGWYMVAAPTRRITFGSLFSPFWMQGVAGSDAPSKKPTILFWDAQKGTFSPTDEMAAYMRPARGYLVYLFEDDNLNRPQVQGGFPKQIKTMRSGDISPVKMKVYAVDANGNGLIDGREGFNLLGNPFGEKISVGALKKMLNTAGASLNNNIYVWNPRAGSGNGQYITLEDDETIAPFQAFWVRYTEEVNETLTFNAQQITAKPKRSLYKEPPPREVLFNLFLGDGEHFDTYKIAFRKGASVKASVEDAYKLFSLNPEAINFFSIGVREVKLAQNVLPPISSLQRTLQIPLAYSLPHAGEYVMRWDGLQKLPLRIKFFLVDRKTGQKIDMRARQTFNFNAYNITEKDDPLQPPPPVHLLHSAQSHTNNPRFELQIVPDVLQKRAMADEKPTMKQPVVLSPNYPNPFQTQTHMSIKLKEKTYVNVTVWNIVGQKIATLMDGTRQKGTHKMTWTVPANLPSGIYICKVEAAGMILTRKMTLVK